MAGKRYVIFRVDPRASDYYVFDRVGCTVKAGPLPVVRALAERDRLNVADEGPGPHEWTPDATKSRCVVCGDGVWGRHRFQEPASEGGKGGGL